MKPNYILLKTTILALLFFSNSWSQTIITQWNFNGTSPTTVPGGGTSPSTSLGNGTAELLGGITATFASGVSSGGSTDPVTTAPENYGWNTTNYAELGTENKQRGIQFNVSTAGYKGITFKFDQRLSNTSNKTYIVQYTTDNSATTPIWVDAQTFIAVDGGDTWYNSRTVTLNTITDLDNNPNVSFRIVSAFDSTTNDYVASTATSTYATTGTSRFDMVTISGDSNLSISQFDLKDNNFIIYPNPSNKGMVYLNKKQDIKVYDTLGKLIITINNTDVINTNSLKTGVYYIKSGSGISKKLIVE